MRKVFHSATVITGKVKVLRDETRGAYSLEPIDAVLEELLDDLGTLSRMKHSPIENLEIPTLQTARQLPALTDTITELI